MLMPPRKSAKTNKQSPPTKTQSLLDCSDFSARLIGKLKKLPHKQNPGSSLEVPPLPSTPLPPTIVYDLMGAPAALPIVAVDAVTRKLFVDKEALALINES